MDGTMSRTILAKYVTPWKFRREQDEQRLRALRSRDGDECRRCRRPLRFDLPAGHDMGPKVEAIVPAPSRGAQTIDNLCLCHRRCTADAADNTSEVQERVRRKNEAELFAKARTRRRA
jgi:hypothetical protein